jgi:FkbM family methyltransferase
MGVTDETSPHPAPAAHQPVGIYLGNDRILTRTRGGIRMILDTRDIILTPLLLLEGEWERETGELIERTLQPGMTFVDVGANMGYFSCLAGARILGGGGKLWAFEADPVTFGYLTDNINLNWFFAGVTLVQGAVHSRSGELTLHVREKYKGNTSIADVPVAELDQIGDRSVPVPVRAISLDDYFGGDTPRIDLIKIDVEGGEPFVLEGMRGLLARQPGMQVLIEWSPGQIWKTGVNPQQVLDFFDEHRFTKRIVGGPGVTTADLGAIGHANLLLTRQA